MKLGDKEARRAGINNWLGPGVFINARTVITYNVQVSTSIGWRPSVPLTLNLNETFHNLNRPGLPGGAFRSTRKAENGLEPDMRRRGRLLAEVSQVRAAVTALSCHSIMVMGAAAQPVRADFRRVRKFSWR